MKHWILIAGLALCCMVGMAFAEEGETVEKPTVIVTTSLGEIVIELDPEKAPITVENFLKYVDDEHYDGTVFHRVIKSFMIQGGGFDSDMVQKENRSPIKNEANNGLKNDTGTIAMARTQVVDSATSQFFINTKDNAPLNFRSADPRGYGYCVFGKVVEGMDVVFKIENSATANKGRFQNVPVETIMIESVRRK